MLHTYLGHTKNDEWEKKKKENQNSILYFKFDTYDVYNMFQKHPCILSIHCPRLISA
jgi:hypothetical protein